MKQNETKQIEANRRHTARVVLIIFLYGSSSPRRSLIWIVDLKEAKGVDDIIIIAPYDHQYENTWHTYVTTIH